MKDSPKVPFLLKLLFFACFFSLCHWALPLQALEPSSKIPIDIGVALIGVVLLSSAMERAVRH